MLCFHAYPSVIEPVFHISISIGTFALTNFCSFFRVPILSSCVHTRQMVANATSENRKMSLITRITASGSAWLFSLRSRSAQQDFNSEAQYHSICKDLFPFHSRAFYCCLTVFLAFLLCTAGTVLNEEPPTIFGPPVLMMSCVTPRYL